MCENPDIMSKTARRRLEESLLMNAQKESGLKVDDNNAYFAGKSIPKQVWRIQALEMGLPADSYLDIATLASNEEGRHAVQYKGRAYLVQVGGVFNSEHGQHREILSITPYQG